MIGLGCEVLFDEEKAARVQELVETATGGPCPCKSGQGCPLIPSNKVVLEMRRTA